MYSSAIILLFLFWLYRSMSLIFGVFEDFTVIGLLLSPMKWNDLSDFWDLRFFASWVLMSRFGIWSSRFKKSYMRSFTMLPSRLTSRFVGWIVSPPSLFINLISSGQYCLLSPILFKLWLSVLRALTLNFNCRMVYSWSSIIVLILPSLNGCIKLYF